jgi:hypothetical protein
VNPAIAMWLWWLMWMPALTPGKRTTSTDKGADHE